MSHIAYQLADLELQADYVVVGSGAGGATIAAALAEGGAEVALIEAGAWRDPEHLPSSMYGSFRDLFDDWGATMVQGRAAWPVIQGRAVGGSTVINSAITVRTPGDIFAQWEREHGVGGERMAAQVWSHQEAIERELYASDTTALARHNQLALDGAAAVGFDSHPTRRLVHDCAGSGQCLQGCRGGHKQSLNLTLVPRVLAHGGHVLSCAPVRRVRIEDGRAVGVIGHFDHPRSHKRGGRFNVHARKGVVLAASVTHTPLLLRASGINDRRVGANFRAHPGCAVLGIYDHPVDANTGATQGWASVAFRDDPGVKLETLSLPSELVVSRIKGGGRELMARLNDYRQLAVFAVAVRAEAVGRVGRIPLIGRPFVRYTMCRADLERLRFGIHKLALTHFAAGAKAIMPGIEGLPPRMERDQVDRILQATLDPRAYLCILTHLFGGAVMGSDPSTAVCDSHGAVYGIDGLVVADASVIPTNLGVNPQLTIMGLARSFADHMLEAQ